MSLLAQVQFVSGVVFHSFLQQPSALVLLLVTLCGIAAVFHLLSQQSFASPRLLLPLLILLLGIIHKSCSLQAELVASESALEEKSWALHQSKNYRTQILRQLSATDGTKEDKKEEVSLNPLDGCIHVFIDIASKNRAGVQLRKLFEPQLFAGDPVLPIFQRFFGPLEKRQPGFICAVGFYPNVINDQHEEHLHALANNYSACGIKVLIKDRKEVAGFTREVLATRSFLPDSAKVEPPSIVVGCDIDACTSEILADMALSGVLGLIDNIHFIGRPLQFSSGDKSQMTLLSALSSLGELTQQLNMESGQFSVEMVEQEGNEETTKLPSFAC